MHFKFTKTIPDEYKDKARLISGLESALLQNNEYIIVRQDKKDIYTFEIRFDISSGLYKEATIAGNILAVGHEEYFYMYNIDKNDNFLRYKVEGYFGHLYMHNNKFFVADACGLTCFDSSGNRIWENLTLAIDGVVINLFETNKIFGSGEQNPPGGWEDFVLDIETGKCIN